MGGPGVDECQGRQQMRVAKSLALILLASLPLSSARAQNPTAPPPAALPSQELPPPYVTRQAEIEVPFSVKASTADAQPAAVRIYVSWDRGANWHLYKEKRPEEGKFRFRAKQDGEFWFATQTVDGVGRTPKQTPTAPQLRLVLDTQKPTLQVVCVPTSDGQVELNWSAADPHLNAMTLKIEYQDASGSGPWTSVVANLAGPTAPGQSTGKITVRPTSNSGAVNFRAEISDVAGNVAYFSQRVSLARPAAGAKPGAIPLAVADSSATPWPADDGAAPRRPERSTLTDVDTSPDVDSGNENRPGTLAGLPRHLPVTSSTQPAVAGPPSYDALPAPDQGSGDRSQPELNPAYPSQEPRPAFRGLPSAVGGVPASPTNSSLELQRPFNSLPRDPGSPRSLLPDSAELPPPDHADGEEVSPRPSFDGPRGAPVPATEALPSPEPGRTGGDLPASPEPVSPHRPGGSGDVSGGAEEPLPGRPRMTNTRRFSLEYDVETVGPDGLADVELWGTTDGGQSWSKWGSDPDKVSPFDVEVNGEGVYGFRVVIVGRNGLASNTPRAGDAADIWIGVDQTRPTARITAAAYGSGAQAGKLDIRWEATDTNLASRPITLSMSERPDGPFSPIAAGLPNTGQYFWEFDPRSPRQIFLRLEVRDDAGNMTIDQLVEPIQVEGLAPKGRIRGFAPAPETSQQPFRSPLFR